MGKTYEIRDPIHGFIELNEWERDIINHHVFQRLRRIRHLGLTNMVYPAAMHTRFEHSLGVMYVATRMFDEIVKRRLDFLRSEMSFTKGGLERDLVLVRLSCLLHDIGHAPFSHATEELMDRDLSTGKTYKHENYSAAAVTFLMQDIIENHPLNQNYNIKSQDVADFLNGRPTLGRVLLWRSLVSSQLDADRADYLLRDSHHIGVAYGKYDLNRLLVTLTVAIDPETQSPVLAIEEGGEHAAEALILARYMMFTQVYFQHTRRAYDHHSVQVIKQLLGEIQKDSNVANKQVFPPPTSKENVEHYLKWDDWRVLGMVHEGLAGENGQILLNRGHHRRVFETPEVPDTSDLEFAEKVVAELDDLVRFVDKAENSWYKFEATDIPILLRPGQGDEEFTTLSRRSTVVSGLKGVSKTRVYVAVENKEAARTKVRDLRNQKEG